MGGQWSSHFFFGSLTTHPCAPAMTNPTPSLEILRDSWEAVRAQFDLSTDYCHLATSQFLVSHPRLVREAIARYQRALDTNPVLYVEAYEDQMMTAVRKALARYLGASDHDQIALTDSTTQGLGILYSALPLGK